MPTIKQYDHDSNPPIPDELATCIAFLQAAKIRAEVHIRGFKTMTLTNSHIYNLSATDLGG
jgi:hypothetical protein